MKRLDQIILIGTFLGFCWLGMQLVHEFGHVLGALCTGGEVEKVVAHPFTISRTDLSHNPHPLIVVWMGPVIGSVLPAAAFFVARLLRSPGLYLFRFFAGFCLVTNGAYIGIGSFQKVMDAGDMMRHGSPQWTLIVFGIAAVAAGLWMWNSLGSKFGLGDTKGKVDRRATVASAILFAAIFIVELVIGSR